MNTDKLLLVASGFSAKQINDYDYKGNGWKIVTINNGWMACEDWDYWVRSRDFTGERPTSIKDSQFEVRKYAGSLNKFGGHAACGYSITLCAGYWCLDNLNPKVIGYLDADMNYTPDGKGHTHIYGVGYDIEKRGIPDPDRMAEMHGKGNPNYLTDIYNRFRDIAKDNDCSVYNFSKDTNTRLPYSKNDPSIIDKEIES